MTQELHLEGNTLPLQGIRVLELGSFIAAPFAARLFGDFGAEVIKIEKPQGGDELRDWRKTRGTTSMLFRTIGRNKKSVALDLHSEAGREAVKKIAAQCDVVIENFRPGTLEKWGLGPDVLQELNPDMVMVRISGYGQTGPYKNRAGFGSSAESFAGLRYITGEPDRPAGRAAASMGDTVAGLYGVIGALMLMLQKARGVQTTGSQVVDVALYEGVFSLLESLVPDYDAYGMNPAGSDPASPASPLPFTSSSRAWSSPPPSAATSQTPWWSGSPPPSSSAASSFGSATSSRWSATSACRPSCALSRLPPLPSSG